MVVRGDERLVHQIDCSAGKCGANEKRTSQVHVTKHARRSSPSGAQPKIYQWDNVATPSASPARANLDCVRSKTSSLSHGVVHLLQSCNAHSLPLRDLHGLRSDLSPVPVRATATITEAGAYRFRLRDPIDLRVSRIGGRSALGFLHELGHLLDHQIFYDRKTRSWASAVHPAFAPWRESAALLEKRTLPGGYSRQRYFQSVHEIWARSYAQTVLLRSGDHALERRLEKLQADDDAHIWSAAQFEPVAIEVELVFERLGLRQLSLPFAA